MDFQPDRDLLRYWRRDSGCLLDAVNLLNPKLLTHRHAILFFDYHGSGTKDPSSIIARSIEKRLEQSGWVDGSATVVVFDSELETWIWSGSPHVADVLGWSEDREALREFLVKAELWRSTDCKPHNPKAAMKIALQNKGKPGSAILFSELAGKVSLNGCTDIAFKKFVDALRKWFPPAVSNPVPDQ